MTPRIGAPGRSGELTPLRHDELHNLDTGTLKKSVKKVLARHHTDENDSRNTISRVRELSLHLTGLVLNESSNWFIVRCIPRQ